MQDLAQIRRANANSFAGAITSAVQAGKHVVAIFHGLQISNFKSFDTKEEGDGYAAEQEKNIGVTAKIYSPAVA